ncbi:response regulator [Deinococcus sp. KNUC1210]|uniref:response regulator n=1 Tax=Deinococcus sp. KNUC1210 TaxID=2917691 RepID=UPI001EEFFAE0|nr:response regulator [Deinococcus sp. KNUC1210]ULH16807.1 response regulator [Deinococcus sp. KNUC1210]
MVDDNLHDLELALEALHDVPTPARVVTALGGSEALAYLNTHTQGDQRPSLVLLDLKMPQLDGLEVLDAIRSTATLHDIPVVILTTSRDEADIRACYKRGANGYVVKPLEFASFATTLRATMTFWLGLNQTPGMVKAQLV